MALKDLAQAIAQPAEALPVAKRAHALAVRIGQDALAEHLAKLLAALG